MSVVIETTLGDITVDLYLNERPNACLNFLKLCKIKYYNFNLFHTISRGFIAQTGDPTGSRTGGECIFGVIEGASKRFFEAENEPRIKHTRPGLLSFVGGEDNMISSQFFLTLGEDLTYLDEKHCVFGEVVEGFDILEAINEVICDNDDRPYQDVRITHTVVLDDPCPDPKGLRLPSRSPSPSPKRLAGGRIAPDEQIDETSGKSYQEIAELQAEREAKARATILEMVGDIPDAEMAPPENVLFVCKLNPVTTDDDLEIIFSRFGNIKSCEVIRDRKSGDSLQYAFIEFKEQKSCEDAYFKMGNVLIDDRRIHVDFSQSVSKVKWLGKGRGVAHYDDKGNKKQADVNNGVGKGDYKTKNGIKDNHSSKRRNASPIRDNRLSSNGSARRHYSRSPRREKQRSRSPRRNRRKSRSSERHSVERQKRFSRQNRSPLYNNRRHYRSPPRRNDYRRSYNRNYRSHSQSRRKSSPRNRSKSPPRKNEYREKSLSPKRSRRERSRSEDQSKHIDRESTPRKAENKSNRKNSKSPAEPRSPRKSAASPKNIMNSLSSISSSSRVENSKNVRNINIQKKELQFSKPSSKMKKKKTHKGTSSDTSEVEIKASKSKKKKSKKKVSSSSETSSSEEESSSSSEEEKAKRNKKRKIINKKKTKKCKKKYSSSESSSSESESSSTESSSDSDDSDRLKKKKYKKKRTSSSSA